MEPQDAATGHRCGVISPHRRKPGGVSLLFAGLSVVLVLLGAGCAQQSVADASSTGMLAPLPEDRISLAQAPDATQPAQGIPRRAPPAPEAEPNLPLQDLTEQILYEFLIAEIAGQRGNVGLAAQAYVDLAKRTRDPRIARRAAEIAIYARMNAAAIDATRIWHETDPGSSRALQALIGLLIGRNQLQDALPYLRKMLSAPGADPGEILMQLNRTLTGAADKKAALELMRELAGAYPALPQAHFAVAQAAAAAGDEAAALAEVRVARTQLPEWDAAVLLEAQVMQRRSNADALAVLKSYLDRYPGSREVRINYARTLVSEKRVGEARAEFQRLLQSYPDSPDVVFAVALLSLQANDYALAETTLKRLLDLDFRDKNLVRLYLGQVAEEQKRLTDALDWYRQVENGDQYIPARVRYAQILVRQGQMDAARAWLQATEVSSSQQRVQLVLTEAQMLRDAGDVKTAFNLVERALDGLPGNPELLYDYAMLAERMERVDVLERSLRKVIELRPDHAHAYNALGYSLADRNLRLAEARDLIEKALKLAPEDPFIIDSMGWVLFRQGDLQGALGHLKRAFAMRPDAEIAAHLAEVLWGLGERGEAERLLREAVQKDPANESLQGTVKRLKP